MLLGWRLRLRAVAEMPGKGLCAHPFFIAFKRSALLYMYIMAIPSRHFLGALFAGVHA